MKPLRIGLVCPYSLDVPGGVQNHVCDLSAVLCRRGHAVQLLAPGEPSSALPAYVTAIGKAVPVPFNGSVARLAFGPRAVGRVRRWLADGGFDVLHVHEPAAPSVSLIALWASDGPVVATFHSAQVRSRAMASTVSVLRPAMEKISARIAVSEAARATVVQHVGGEPVVIPNGVSYASFADAEPRPEWTLGGSAVVFLGRVEEPRKGFEVLLSALPAVVEEHPQAHLLVAGRGDRDRWEIRGPLDEHVTFLGQVSDEDRCRLLASAAVYVAPNLGGESFGIVLVEAMAAGAAVVASDIPAFADLLHGGALGRLVRPGDAAGLAAAISGLLADAEGRAAMSARARAAARRFDWQHVVRDVEAVYATVVAGSRAPGL